MRVCTHHGGGVGGWAAAFMSRGRMCEIGASPGDVLELVGGGRTLARCYHADLGLPGGDVSVHYRKALDLGIGHWGCAEVRRVDASAARAVTLAPNGQVPEAGTGYIADGLDGTPLAPGDAVSVGYCPRHEVRFQVARVEPEGAAAVATAETAFRMAGSGEESRAVPRVPRPGTGMLEADVGRLRGMIGPRLAGRGAAGRRAPPCGAAVHGSAYLEKGLLVRTAAAECGAHLAVVDVRCMSDSVRARRLRKGDCTEGSSEASLRDEVAAAAATAGDGERMLRLCEYAPLAIVEAARGRAPSVVLLDFENWDLGPVREEVADWINRRQLRGGGGAGGRPDAWPGQVSGLSRGIASLVSRLAGAIGDADQVAVVTSAYGLDFLPPALADAGFAGGIEVGPGKYGMGAGPAAGG